MHVIAGKAVAFGEALKPEFRDYSAQVLNASAIWMSDGPRLGTRQWYRQSSYAYRSFRQRNQWKGRRICIGEGGITAITTQREEISFACGVRIGTPGLPHVASKKRNDLKPKNC